MATTRRRFTAQFKAKVAMEALRGDRTIQAIAAKHEVHPNQVSGGQSTYPLPKDTSQKDTDGRRDRDANWGVKGSGERKHYWFGYLLHLVVDATYEVPLAFEVTKASTAEQPQAQRLLDQMQDRHPELLQRCGCMSADKGYDDHKLIDRLWQQHQIKPIIAIRNCWRDGEAKEDGVLTKLVSGQENVIYTHDGQVSCMWPQTGELHPSRIRTRHLPCSPVLSQPRWLIAGYTVTALPRPGGRIRRAGSDGSPPGSRAACPPPGTAPELWHRSAFLRRQSVRWCQEVRVPGWLRTAV